MRSGRRTSRETPEAAKVKRWLVPEQTLEMTGLADELGIGEKQRAEPRFLRHMSGNGAVQQDGVASRGARCGGLDTGGRGSNEGHVFCDVLSQPNSVKAQRIILTAHFEQGPSHLQGYHSAPVSYPDNLESVLACYSYWS